MLRRRTLIVALIVVAVAATPGVVGLATGASDHRTQMIVTSEARRAGRPSATLRSCAKRLGQAPVNHNRRSSHVLVPMSPRQVLLCRYFGAPLIGLSHQGRVGTLARERLIRGSAIARSLGHAFDRLSPFGSGEYTCPADSGAALYAVFIYEDQADALVTVSLGGCPSATNDRAPSAFQLSSGLERRLKRLTQLH